jgi:hypothetical protein
MLSSTKRRMAVLERSIERPITADRFLSCVQDHMRLTGVNFDDAARCVMAPFGAQKLDSLVGDLLDSVFGADEHAKQEWRRDAEMKAAYKTGRKNDDKLSQSEESWHV